MGDLRQNDSGNLRLQLPITAGLVASPSPAPAVKARGATAAASTHALRPLAAAARKQQLVEHVVEWCDLPRRQVGQAQLPLQATPADVPAGSLRARHDILVAVVIGAGIRLGPPTLPPHSAAHLLDPGMLRHISRHETRQVRTCRKGLLAVVPLPVLVLRLAVVAGAGLVCVLLIALDVALLVPISDFSLLCLPFGFEFCFRLVQTSEEVIASHL
mmetsp:Transcript_55982/g.160826  ORF Transcript_55982/g.160826 Transcript_55982/m.160826 type:complete len:215 (-) Transcript_55982:42-686(-)